MQTVISLRSCGMGLALVPASVGNLKRTGLRYLGILRRREAARWVHRSLLRWMLWRDRRGEPVLLRDIPILCGPDPKNAATEEIRT